MKREREESNRLNARVERHQVHQIIMNELDPRLSITINSYRRMVGLIDTDSTMNTFKEQLKVLDTAIENVKEEVIGLLQALLLWLFT